ncbi:MAG: hypothetical protein U1F52_20990 [Burkholderiales bacterium]
MNRRRVLILGAAGRDFHNFNVVFRESAVHEVVVFTATQIPGIAGRHYPASLAGPLYPDGIPILPEADLEGLCRSHRVDEVVFAYSDTSHPDVMHLASRALAAGADFTLLGPERTMLRAHCPVIAISSVRTGCGKSQIARWVSNWCSERDVRVAVLRHPMPYGDLGRQAVQRFATRDDLTRADCTAEEREEYEPHLAAGHVVFAGVDYAAILAAAEAEADVLLWEGGNNDFPFLRPDLHLVVTDALRPDQIDTHHPGETNVRMADIVIVNKANAAPGDGPARMERTIRRLNPLAEIVRGASVVYLDQPEAVRGKRVMVVDDGPTLTHGGMSTGAGFAAALAAEVGRIIDPRESAAPEIEALYRAYPHLGVVLPAVGYSPADREALRATIDDSRAEVVIAGTPIDLATLIRPNLPVVRAHYDFVPWNREVLDRALQAVAGRTAPPSSS